MDPNSKISRGVLAAGLAAALAAGALAADVQALRFYEDAVNRFHAGDVKGAVIQLRNSLQRDPTQLPARVLMGQILLDQGALPEAEEELIMAAKLGADPASIALPLAQARNRQGRHEQVLEELNPTAYPVGIRADLWVELARARQGSGDRVGADIALAEALKLAPHHQDAMLTRAGSWLEQRDYEKAARTLNDVLGRYPESAPAWLLMGSVYHAQGEFDSAVAHYRQALKLAPGSQQARLGEALALLDGGETEQAAQILQQMRAEQPLALEPHYFHAQALRAVGDAAGAAAALGDAAELVNSVTPVDLGDDTAHLSLAAKVKTETGEYEGAYSFLSRYLELRPQDLQANKQLARLLVRLNKPGDALRLLTRMRASHPDDTELLVMLGDVNSKLRDYLAAERYYGFALEAVQGNSALVSRIGLSKLQQGETRAAIDVFEQLVGDDPESGGRGSVFLGILYLSDGRIEEAKAIADAVAEADPDNLVARNLQAVAAIAAGERTQGRQILQQINATAPDFRPAQLNLVKLDILEARYAAAGERLATLLGDNPDDTLALRESARLAAAQGDRATAIERLEQIRNSDPRAVRPLVELTRLYRQAGQSAEALQVALDLDRHVPDNLEAKMNLAGVQQARGETAQARSLLQDAARLAGSNVDELVRVASRQIGVGDLEAAEVYLRKALDLRPGSVAARKAFARLYAQRGNYPEAVTEVSAALQQAPEDASLLILLADIRIAQGQAGAAVELYRRAQALADSASLMVKLYRALWLDGQRELAFSRLRAWHEENPQEASVMRILADHYQQTGDRDAALELYWKLVELTPDSALAHNNLANLLLPVDAEQALAAALRAHGLARENAAVLDTLGWILVQLGELERGLAYLREAVARSSRSPALRYHLAVALEEYGNRDDARRELRRALQMGKPFAEQEAARQRLSRLETLD